MDAWTDTAPLCRSRHGHGKPCAVIPHGTLGYAQGDATMTPTVRPPHHPPEQRNPTRNLISPFRAAPGLTNSFYGGTRGGHQPWQRRMDARVSQFLWQSRRTGATPSGFPHILGLGAGPEHRHPVSPLLRSTRPVPANNLAVGSAGAARSLPRRYRPPGGWAPPSCCAALCRS